MTPNSIARKPRPKGTFINAANTDYSIAANRAKQLAPTNYDGYVIGDGILFHLEENRLVFVGRAPAASWIQFHAETGGFNVKTRKDDRSPGNTKGNAIVRTNYRFQIQGPNAWKVIEKLNGIITAVTNAGTASVRSSHFTRARLEVISTPT